MKKQLLTKKKSYLKLENSTKKLFKKNDEDLMDPIPDGIVNRLNLPILTENQSK